MALLSMMKKRNISWISFRKQLLQTHKPTNTVVKSINMYVFQNFPKYYVTPVMQRSLLTLL